jgi:hypothetical protein
MRYIYPYLCQKMREVGLTTTRLAEELNLQECVLLSRLRGESEWKLHEVVAICCLLNTSDIDLLFVQL